jgi:hypothetical protein
VARSAAVARAFACRDTAAADAASDVLEAQGIRVVNGDDPPVVVRGVAWRVVVRDRAGAARAVRAALAGIDLVIEPGGDEHAWTALLEDLRRLGPLEHVTAALDGGTPLLEPETLLLLAHLASGSPVAEAARRTGVSRRTADRRLAEARRAFGVGTTVEAVMAAREAGAI